MAVSKHETIQNAPAMNQQNITLTSFTNRTIIIHGPRFKAGVCVRVLICWVVFELRMKRQWLEMLRTRKWESSITFLAFIKTRTNDVISNWDVLSPSKCECEICNPSFRWMSLQEIITWTRSSLKNTVICKCAPTLYFRCFTRIDEAQCTSASIALSSADLRQQQMKWKICFYSQTNERTIECESEYKKTEWKSRYWVRTAHTHANSEPVRPGNTWLYR